MIKIMLVPVLLVLLGTVAGASQPQFQHAMQLDRLGSYVMRWNYNEEDIEIQIEVATQGYVGLGFSPTGGMDGADIILGWVDDDGQPFLSDRHATGTSTPRVDASQDVALLSGTRNDTHTTLRFRRPLAPCDLLHDLPITSSTMRVIWAFDSQPRLPRNASAPRLPYHDHRGALSLYMAGDSRLDYSTLHHVRTWDVLAPNVSLPNDVDTLYWCKMYKMPSLDRKHHYIGYEPHIADHMVPYVHHMILYECHAPGVDTSSHFERWVDQLGAQCYAPNMPESWNACNMPILVWAVGDRGFSLPEEAGFPLGEEHDGATYFMLEIHYNNPDMIQNLVDSSGVRMYYTPELRPYDAGILQFGHNVEPFQIIPPSTVWNTTGHCHSECTRQTLPASGIQIFSAALHAHVLGRGVALQHIRDGVELAPVIEDDKYDFNYQQERVLQPPRTVLPGDHFIVTCSYDASLKPITTYGGFKTTDEMCLVFASYFPRQRLTECHSRPDVALLLDTLGVLNMRDNMAVLNGFQIKPFDISNVNEDRERNRIEKMTKQPRAGASYDEFILAHYLNTMVIDAPPELNGTTLLGFLNDKRTWQNKTVLQTLQQRVTTGQYEPHCVYRGRGMPTGVPKKAKYPQYASYVKPKTPCTRANVPSTSAAPTVHSPSMLDHRSLQQQSQSSFGQHQALGYIPTVNQEPSPNEQQSINAQHQFFGYLANANRESNFQNSREAYEISGHRNPPVPYDGFNSPSIVSLGDRSSPNGGDRSSLRGEKESPANQRLLYENERRRDDGLLWQSSSSRDGHKSLGDELATIHEQLLENVNKAPVDVTYSFATDPTRPTGNEFAAGEQRAAGPSEEGAASGAGRGEAQHSAQSRPSSALRISASPHFSGLVAFLLALLVP